MEIQDDFRELLASFNAHEVEYLIVGGYALAYLGHPRATGDIDLYVQPTPENARRVMAALADFGFGAVGLEAKDFELPGKVVQLGFPPVRIDIVTSITGVDWQAARAGRAAATYGGVPVFHIGREQFIANKRATARKKDLGDIESLGRK
jgi:predicted nucleotidyltransferase